MKKSNGFDTDAASRRNLVLEKKTLGLHAMVYKCMYCLVVLQ